MQLWILVVLYSILYTTHGTIHAPIRLGGLEIVHQWKYLNWEQKVLNLTGKKFTLGNPLSQDVDVDVARNRVFVTSPHWLEGTPITLSVVTHTKGSGGPLLTPYPNWKWHTPNCDGITSVYRIAVDKCNRLWLVDNGSVGRTSVCPKKLLVFDLKTDRLLHKYYFPEDQTFNGSSQLVTPIVEIRENCADAHLYIADVIKHGLLVYSLRDDRSWRWNNTVGNAFGFDEDSVDFNIAGEDIQLKDGILGMSLSPPGLFDKRYLYFNSMGSYYEKFASTESLKNTNALEPIIYRTLHKRISQAGPQATSKAGVVFFQLAQMTALACWNMERPFTPENVVVLVQDETALQYIGGIKVVTNVYGEEEVWFNTNRLQKTIKGTRKLDEVNYRILKGKVNKLIKGTNCEPSGNKWPAPNLESWERI